MVTPHPNLVSVPGSVHAPRTGETREAAYLRSGIVEASAGSPTSTRRRRRTTNGIPPRTRLRGRHRRLARLRERRTAGALVCRRIPDTPPRPRCCARRGRAFATSSTGITSRSPPPAVGRRALPRDDGQRSLATVAISRQSGIAARHSFVTRVPVARDRARQGRDLQRVHALEQPRDRAREPNSGPVAKFDLPHQQAVDEHAARPWSRLRRVVHSTRSAERKRSRADELARDDVAGRCFRSERLPTTPHPRTPNDRSALFEAVDDDPGVFALAEARPRTRTAPVRSFTQTGDIREPRTRCAG